MNRNYKLEHELLRRQLWIDTCSRVAGASNCTDCRIGPKYADKALELFDKKFTNDDLLSEG